MNNIEKTSQKNKRSQKKRKNTHKSQCRKSKKRKEPSPKHHRVKIKQIDQRVGKFFNKINLLHIARITKYYIKESPITPFIFIYALSFELFGYNTSLDLLAIQINTLFKIDITAQAFCARMSQKKSVNFLKEAFEAMINVQIAYSFPNSYQSIFGMFKGVELEDSTTIILNEKVKEFKGSGGAASKSSFKLNWLFNICNCSTVDVNILSGKTPDQKIAHKNLKYLKKKKGTLLIRDLGYFAISALKTIAKFNCYFLSRLVKGTLIYLHENDQDPVNIKLFFQKITRGGRSSKFLVYIGQERYPVWLIVQKVPNWVLKKRIKQYKSKHSWKFPSEEYIEWSKYTIFITNILDELLENANCDIKTLVFEIYRLRWQIELLFKSFKSTMKIHCIKGKNKNRVLCLIYGKLIAIMLAMTVLSYAASQNYKGRELSIGKVADWLVNDKRLAKAILQGDFGDIFIDCLRHFKLLSKDKRKRETSQETVQRLLTKKYAAA
jgi:hypothetical protein